MVGRAQAQVNVLVRLYCCSVVTQLPRIESMPLNRSREPFSSRDWLFELKYDGFRALAEIESGRCRLVSRNGNAFASFHELALRIGRLFPKNRVVMDGEIACLDKHGRPQFKNLLFRRGEPSFVAFDLLYDAGKDLRQEQLLDRKAELRRVLSRVARKEPVMYAEHVEQLGEALFRRVCELDLEGIVAKLRSGPYVSERENSTWRKILNPHYSQRVGRNELFERERHKEPVAGWHSCVLACAELE